MALLDAYYEDAAVGQLPTRLMAGLLSTIFSACPRSTLELFRACQEFCAFLYTDSRGGTSKYAAKDSSVLGAFS